MFRGLAVLSIFFVVIISTDLYYPYALETDGYTVVGIRRLNENPLPLEGSAISSSATIVSAIDQGSYHSVEVSKGVTLVFPSTIGHPEKGQRILFRGISWLYSNGSILVHEFYPLNYSSSIIRSILEILLFIVMFFMIFRIDFNRLAFVSRKRGAEIA